MTKGGERMNLLEAVKKVDSNHAVYRKSWNLKAPEARPTILSSNNTGIITTLVWADKGFALTKEEVTANDWDITAIFSDPGKTSPHRQ